MGTRKQKDDAGLLKIVSQKMQELDVPAPSINEADAGICWDLNWMTESADKENPWRDLHVLDLAAIRNNPDSREARIWRAAGSSDGACMGPWLGNPRHTCLGFFSGMCFEGKLPSKQDYIRVLKEFAKVRECDWARHMLAALVSSSIMDEDQTDLVPEK